ncbi:unnamed protein product [Camellia sinensis]
MKNLSMLVVVLFLFISTGSGSVLQARFCEEILYSTVRVCDDKECNLKCQLKRKAHSYGICKLIDTCYCEYPC